MKKAYPKYFSGELVELYESLEPGNKKLLDEFVGICGITAGKQKQEKIRRILLQLYDVTETDFDKQTKETIIGFIALLSLIHI